MLINSLKLKYKRKAKKSIGRGGKKGTYSGRGGKGQTARSGSHIDPLFEGGRSSLIDHMKKIRGFKSPHDKLFPVDISKIEKNFSDGATVNERTLLNSGIVRKKKIGGGIKILGSAELKKKFTIGREITLSARSKAAIEKAGGSIEAGGREREAKNKKQA